jgi:hypothetical protein
MDRQSNRHSKYKQMDRQAKTRTDRQRHGQTGEDMDRQANRWTDIQTNGQTDVGIYKQMDRQGNGYINVLIRSFMIYIGK